MTTQTSRKALGRLAADAAGLLRLAWDNLRIRVREWRTHKPPQYIDVRSLIRRWERGGDGDV
jgi:hypothetical protein